MPGLIERARPLIQRLGQAESSWRAWAFLAKAGSGERARSAAIQASAALAEIQKGWSPADVDSYLSRPDVRELRAELIRMQH